MMAPVAAPHPAPWPVGVSQELRNRELSDIPEIIRTAFVFIKSGLPSELINRTGTDWLRSKSAQAVRPRTQLGCSDLRPYKYFVYFGINGQSAVSNFRAIILFMRRVWAHDNTRRIMGISRGHGVAISGHRILLLSLCLGDGFRFIRPVASWLAAYTSDP